MTEYLTLRETLLIHFESTLKEQLQAGNIFLIETCNNALNFLNEYPYGK